MSRGLPVLEIAVAGDVFDGVLLCCVFSHEMSWMRSGTALSQFPRVFLPFLILITEKTRTLKRQLTGLMNVSLPLGLNKAIL